MAGCWFQGGLSHFKHLSDHRLLVPIGNGHIMIDIIYKKKELDKVRRGGVGTLSNIWFSGNVFAEIVNYYKSLTRKT